MTRLLPFAVLWSLSPLAACAPSPDQLRSTLRKHPDILVEAIREHPAEIMEALQAAADSYQRVSQATAARAEDGRIARELASPRVPSVEPGRAIRGNRAATVTIVEYSDFQCPYCRREVPVLRSVLERYDGRVRLVLKQAPLEIHPHARAAAGMFEAVLRQSPDQAWRLHDLLFANQERLGAEGARYLEAAVRAVGADLARARRDAAGPEVAAILDRDQAEFQRFGFSGTPAFLINGVVLDGARPVEAFERVILQALDSPAPPPGLARPGGSPSPP